MARFVRCIEGHAFDADATPSCPVCGATPPAGEPAAPAAFDAAAAIDKTPPGEMPAGRSSPSTALVAVVAAVIGVAAVAGYLAWSDEDQPASSAQTALPSPVAAVAPSTPPQVAPAPPPAKQAEARAPAVTEAKPQLPESGAGKPDEQKGQSGTVWSQFSGLQGNSPAQRTPPQAAAPQNPVAVPKLALASLAPDDRDILNNKITTMFLMFDVVRRADPRANRGLPWTDDVSRRSFRPRPQLEAAASAGKWSADAIAVGAWLDGWRAFVTDDPDAVAVMENAVGLGSLVAAKNLGDFFMHGYRQFGADPVRAARWYEASVALGNPDAAGRLSVLYRDGNGVGADRERARRLFLMAAEGGSAIVSPVVEGVRRRRNDATRQLATFGLKPEDLPLNSAALYGERKRFGQVPVARELLDRSIKGDRIAMNALTSLMVNNEVFEQDNRSIGRIAMEAGKRGYGGAMATYGYLLSEGPPDIARPAEAPLWLFVAWALDQKNSNLRELFRLSLEKLSKEQSEPIVNYFTAASTNIGMPPLDRPNRR